MVELLNKALVNSLSADSYGMLEIEGILHSSNLFNHPFISNTREEYQTRDLNLLPIPDYDEYFSLLNSFCDSPMTARQLKQNVTLLTEGSRGCLFRCNFCGFNSVWRGYRSKTTSRIMETVEYLSCRHGIARMYFVDNLCDPWAKDFASEMVRTRRGMQSFMEMRASHEETFWTGLKLSGIERIQVGVESISPDLLRAMNKKTNVIENIRAVKYLTELGIVSSANLITYHPGSTKKDIAMTKELLLKIKHLPPFTLSGFAVCVGSPIYNALRPEEKDEIVEATESRYIDSSLKPYCLDWRLSLPREKRLPSEVRSGWDQFTSWYKKFTKSIAKDVPTLVQRNVGKNALLLLDTRNGCDEHLLQDRDFHIYETCHHAPTSGQIRDITGIPDTIITERLKRLVEQNLVLNLEDRFLSLALRDTNILINHYYDSTN